MMDGAVHACSSSMRAVRGGGEAAAFRARPHKKGGSRSMCAHAATLASFAELNGFLRDVDIWCMFWRSVMQLQTVSIHPTLCSRESQ